MGKNRSLNKAIKIFLIILGAIVGLLLLVYAVLAIIGCIMYGEARSEREYVCRIAGINDGIAPQGITYSKEKDIYLQSGYGSDNTTLLYITEKDNSRRVKLLDADGKTLKGHAGGVTCVKDCVYIADGDYLYLFSLDELYTASSTTQVKVKHSIPVDNSASFCFNDGNYLYVGEFYRAGNYETEKTHYYTTPNGEQNKAIVSRYMLDSNGFILEYDGQPYPDLCISVTGLVQGFATHNNVFVLSRSYGLKNTDLEYHTAPKNSGKTVTVKFANNKNAVEKQVPLYYLDSSTNFKTLVLPAFGEDLTIVKNRVVTTNEASANKYFIGKLFGSDKVYSYPLYSVGDKN